MVKVELISFEKGKPFIYRRMNIQIWSKSFLYNKIGSLMTPDSVYLVFWVTVSPTVPRRH